MLELGYEIVHKNKRPVFFSGRLFWFILCRYQVDQ